MLSIVSNIALTAHFIDDVTSKPINGLEHIWDELHLFYEDDLPKIIRIKYHDDEFSGFEPPAKLWISTKLINDRPKFLEVVKHEVSHLGLYQMTDGSSYTNRFRFIDEGLANVLRYEESAVKHRNQCKKIAKKFLDESRISFIQVMDWKTYFGDPFDNGTVDFRAYDIGSNFIYFITDEYGKEKLRELLNSLGKTISFDDLVLKAFGKNTARLEAEWKEYILNL